MLRKLIVPALFLSVVAGGVGCESLGGGGESDADKAERRADNRARREANRDRDTLGDRDTLRDRDTVRDRDTTRIERRTPDDNVVGSGRATRSAGGLDSIPRSAARVDAAAGTSVLDYTARRDGQVYIYDVTDDRVVWTGELRDGERFVLDPREDTALINGRKISDESLRANFRTGNSYRLYFNEEAARR